MSSFALFFVVGAAGWGRRGGGGRPAVYICPHPTTGDSGGRFRQPTAGRGDGRCDGGGTAAVIGADVEKFATAAVLGGRLYDPTAGPLGGRQKGQIPKCFQTGVRSRFCFTKGSKHEILPHISSTHVTSILSLSFGVFIEKRK